MRAGLAGMMVLAAAATAVGQGRATEPLTFTHISDMHLSPYLKQFESEPTRRGAASIRWISRHAGGPQQVAPWEATIAAPQFAVATGDLVEFGVSDKTWTSFERAFADMPYPVYVASGNHDNTWNAMTHILRARHGGLNYSFERDGVHFAIINSASIQEALPTFDGFVLDWLKKDLDRLAPGTPVIVAFHHPPYGGGFANPAAHDSLIDLLRNHNVLLLLYGHGHSVRHANMDGIDGVMGGSTYGPNAGYGVVEIAADRLRYAYHFYKLPKGGDEGDGEPGWRAVFEKPIARTMPQRLFAAAMDGEDRLVLTLNAAAEVEEIVNLDVRVNGEPVKTEWVAEAAAPTWTVSWPALAPGKQFVSIRGRTPDGRSELRTLTRTVAGGVVWQQQFPSGFRAGPAVLSDGEQVVVAGTDGRVRVLAAATGKPAWEVGFAGEIIGTPAVFDGGFVFGGGDGSVYAFTNTGNEIWRQALGAINAVPILLDQDADGDPEADVTLATPVYGAPLVAAGTVYIGDNNGQMHAVDLKTGSVRWTAESADHGIEHAPVVWGDLVVYGAWDGFMYAVDRTTGQRRWKSAGPKSSEGRGVRYYAPADCSPVVIDDAFYVTDRGYVLGRYDREGKLTPTAESVSAIAPAARGGFFARYLDNRVGYYGPDGEQQWETAVPAGRFPHPPAAAGDTVFLCSDRGILSALDAMDGELRWQYRVTPGLYVMANIATLPDGTCIVAATDGSVTALRAGGAVAQR